MMENTANSTYSSLEFDELLKDKANTLCFDCGKGPAHWASVNNSVYLCMNCAGVHRGFGVTISYIRSITIDTWNETQINFMKVGGNKRLEELLKLFEIPNTTPADVLYASKLLDYHRNQIKSDVNKGKQLIPPKPEEALQPINSSVIVNSNNSNNSNIYSVSSDFDSNKNNQKSGGFFSSMTTMFNSAIEKGKNVATNVTEKVKDMEITHKIINTGAKTVEVLKETGSLVKEKGSHAVEVLKDTSSKVMHKGLEAGVNYFIFIYVGNG